MMRMLPRFARTEIAAVALRRGVKLATGNMADFTAMQGHGLVLPEPCAEKDREQILSFDGRRTRRSGRITSWRTSDAGGVRAERN
jgi:hypothetical protein